MSMYEYGVGGNEVKLDVTEAIKDIPSNRTFFIQKLTEEAPFAPESVYDLRTTKAVFEHYKPKVNVTFETEDGITKKEELAFNSVADFKAKSLINNCNHLSGLNVQKEQYHKITKQLGSNRALMKALKSDETKAAIIDVVKGALEELAAVQKDEEGDE